MRTQGHCCLSKAQKTRQALLGVLVIPLCLFAVNSLVNYAFYPHFSHRFPPVDVVDVISNPSAPTPPGVLEALYDIYLAHENAYLTEVDTTVAAAPLLEWGLSHARLYLEGGPYSLSNNTFSAQEAARTTPLVLWTPTANLTMALNQVAGFLRSLYASAGLPSQTYLVSTLPAYLGLLAVSRVCLVLLQPAFLVSAGLLYTQFNEPRLRMAVNVTSFVVLCLSSFALLVFYFIRIVVDVRLAKRFPDRYFYYATVLDVVFELLYVRSTVYVLAIILSRAEECAIERADKIPTSLSSIYSDGPSRQYASAGKTPSLHTQKSPANSPQSVVVPQSLDPMASTRTDERAPVNPYRRLPVVLRSVTAPVLHARRDVLPEVEKEKKEQEGKEKEKEEQEGKEKEKEEPPAIPAPALSQSPSTRASEEELRFI